MNVIAFSLYGSNPIYIEGIERQIPALNQFYRGWEIHVFGSGHPSHHTLRKSWGELFYHAPPSWILSPPSWRLAAVTFYQAERVIFRDADSRPSHREADAVYEWIDSGLPVHVMRDNAHHRKPMLSGMWGCVPAKIPDLVPLWIEWQAAHINNPLGYGNDEDFLNEVVWPIAQQVGVMQHDRWQLFPGSKPFPGDAINQPESFIGEKVNPDGSPVDPSYRTSRPEHFA